MQSVFSILYSHFSVVNDYCCRLCLLNHKQIIYKFPLELGSDSWDENSSACIVQFSVLLHKPKYVGLLALMRGDVTPFGPESC